MSSSLDGFIRPGQDDLKEFKEIDKAIAQAIKDKDPAPIAKYGYRLRVLQQIGAVGVCKLSAALKDNWPSFVGVDESWDDYAQAELGIEATTARNYARVWNNIFDNEELPQEVKSELAGWNVTSLVDIASAAERGELEGHWDEILAASNRSEVRNILRELRGQEITSANGLKLFLFKDGSLKAKVGKTKYIAFGWLNLEEDDETIMKAVSRIKDAAGILEM